MNGPRSGPDLEAIQRWMQAVIVHPQGVEAGLNSPAARQSLDLAPEQVERVILPSRRLSSIERLRIYAHAYYARLLECLREEFPALRHFVGDEAFDGFAVGYLQAYPSRSYTLADLGKDFPRFLAETRPGDDADDRPNWADAAIELATLERVYAEVFDGPGVENEPLLQPDDLRAIAVEDWPAARLIPVPCLRLMEFAFPVHEYISAVRKSEAIPLLTAQATCLVVTRRDYVVRRCAVAPREFRLLGWLAEGATVGEAIERLAQEAEPDLETLAAHLQRWFAHWAAAGYFQAVRLPPT